METRGGACDCHERDTPSAGRLPSASCPSCLQASCSDRPRPGCVRPAPRAPLGMVKGGPIADHVPSEGAAGESVALIGVEALRRIVPGRGAAIARVCTEAHVQRVWQPPRQHMPTRSCRVPPPGTRRNDADVTSARDVVRQAQELAAVDRQSMALYDYGRQATILAVMDWRKQG